MDQVKKETRQTLLVINMFTIDVTVCTDQLVNLKRIEQPGKMNEPSCKFLLVSQINIEIVKKSMLLKSDSHASAVIQSVHSTVLSMQRIQLEYSKPSQEVPVV